MLVPTRNYSNPVYRYGFNGKEMDNEISGSGNMYDYGFRIYNSRLGRFLSLDPLTGSFPSLTPYQFASNSPIRNVDLDGLESIPWEKIWEKVKTGKKEVVKTANEVIDDAASVSLIAVAKEIFTGVDKLTTEAQKQQSFSTSSDQTVAILLYEFATGTGKAERKFEFNKNPITNEFVQGRVFEEVVSDFYAKVNDKGLSFEDFAKGGAVNYGLEFSPDDTEGGLQESVEKHINSNLAQFFVGGANVSVSAVGEDGTANVTITNYTSRKSLLAHKGKNYQLLNRHLHLALKLISQNSRKNKFDEQAK